jgi:GMP synthase-like glutamine amidotransferase
MTDTYKLCMLDCSNRINLNEGDMIKDMFSVVPSVIVDVFSVRYGHWPSIQNVSLKNVDDALAPYVQKDDATKFMGVYPVTCCSLNVEIPSPKIVIEYIEQHYDGVVIGGSQDSCMDDSLPYVQPLLEVIRLCVNDKNIPLLGICFGAQAIARALHGDSHVDTMANKGYSGEYGIIEIILSEHCNNPIFERLPKKFFTTISHGDCFIIPEEKDKLAKTRNWDNQAYQIKDKSTWGLQFHPEFKAKDTEILLLRVRDRLGPNQFIHHDAPEPDPYVTKTIAENFINQITARK